jgi:hypothetical protein
LGTHTRQIHPGISGPLARAGYNKIRSIDRFARQSALGKRSRDQGSRDALTQTRNRVTCLRCQLAKEDGTLAVAISLVKNILDHSLNALPRLSRADQRVRSRYVLSAKPLKDRSCRDAIPALCVPGCLE